MEPHPIPQNVTSFQFRLVGDMTLKQFTYLAIGLSIAYLTFIFLAARAPFVAWPIIVISSLLGVAFAFLPIADRPLDHWVLAFLKAVYSPTKRRWQKNNRIYLEEPLFRTRLNLYMSKLQKDLKQQEDKSALTPSVTLKIAQPSTPKEEQPSTPLSQLVHSISFPRDWEEKKELPSKEELEKTIELAKQAQALQLKIIETERHLTRIKAEMGKPTLIPIDYTQQVNTMLNDLQRLISQASQIKEQLASVTHQAQPQEAVFLPKHKIKISPPPTKPKPTQPALTTFPNVINGIVLDADKNYLNGVIVVMYDKDGLPVRALKTNKLGQFSGTTPLPNGTYTVELEKEGFSFDVLQIELTGQVLPPLQITAKKIVNSS